MTQPLVFPRCRGVSKVILSQELRTLGSGLPAMASPIDAEQLANGDRRPRRESASGDTIDEICLILDRFERTAGNIKTMWIRMWVALSKETIRGRTVRPHNRHPGDPHQEAIPDMRYNRQPACLNGTRSITAVHCS